MKHYLLSAVLLTGLLGFAPQAQSQEEGILLIGGVGTSIPIGTAISDIASAGLHVDVGGYITLPAMDTIMVGVHASYDLPSVQSFRGGYQPEATFLGITGRVQYLIPVSSFDLWANLGLGLFKNKLSVLCTGTSCQVDDQTKLGMDLSVGFDYPITRAVTIGPSVGITATNLIEFGDQLLLTASLRASYGI